MKLSKEEYSALYFIDRNGANNLDRLKNYIEKSEEYLKSLLNKLAKLGYIKLSPWKGDEFYGFILTSKGEETLTKEEYSEWYLELGD